jgi:hypothetical protein
MILTGGAHLSVFFLWYVAVGINPAFDLLLIGCSALLRTPSLPWVGRGPKGGVGPAVPPQPFPFLIDFSNFFSDFLF